MIGSIVEPPRRNTEAPWCSVFHQSTENLMIGKSIGADQRENGRRPCRARRIVHRAPQRNNAEIEQKQNELGSQPRVPHPVGAPFGPSPQRAGDETKQRETGADRRGGLGRDVGERMAPDQGAERRHRHQPPAQHAEPGRRHMQVHDLDGGSLLIIVRRDHRLIDCEGEDQYRKPLSHGIVRLAKRKNRDGLARSRRAISNF